MHRSIFFILPPFLLLTVCLSYSISHQPYRVSEKKDLGNNKYEYINSPLYEGSDAGAFNPELGPVEAAIAKFLSSKARGDSAWRKAFVPESEWTDRLKGKLKEWEIWKIMKWQLKSLQINDRKAYLTVYFEIELDGDTYDGEDEFELVFRSNVWMLLEPPS